MRRLKKLNKIVSEWNGIASRLNNNLDVSSEEVDKTLIELKDELEFWVKDGKKKVENG